MAAMPPSSPCISSNTRRRAASVSREVDFAKGEIDSAAAWYEKAAAASPNWEKPWFKLALVALNKGDMETAKTNFQKVIDIAPDSEEGVQAQATLAALP